MKKLESNFINMALSLLLIAAVAAALLAWVFGVTKAPIEKINAETLSNGIKSVIVGDSDVNLLVEDPVEKDGYTFYRAFDASNDQLLGTAVRSVDHNGFGGDIVVLVGFDPDGTILGYEVLEHSETPGLGAQAGEWFKQSAAASTGEQSAAGKAFFGRSVPAGNHNIIGMNPGTAVMTVSKDGGDVDAITASTITSRAFLRAIQGAYDATMSNVK